MENVGIELNENIEIQIMITNDEKEEILRHIKLEILKR